MTAIIQMAHSLGLKTTAEGIEDSATHEVLKVLGCDLNRPGFRGGQLV